MAFQDFDHIQERRRQERERKFRKRVTIGAISCFVLLILVAGGVFAAVTVPKKSDKQNKASSKPKDVSKASKIIATVCNVTYYKKSCNEALSDGVQKHPDTVDPEVFLKYAMTAASAEVDSATEKLKGLKFDDKKEQEGWEYCKTLVSRARDEYKRSIGDVGKDFEIKDLTARASEMKCWLSAVITYSDMCADAFPEGKKRTDMQKNWDATRMLTDNALALVEQFAVFVEDDETGSKKPSGRRLLEKNTNIVDNSEGHSVDEQEAINVDNMEGHSVDEFFPSDEMIGDSEESGGGGMKRRLLQKRTKNMDDSEGHSVDEQEAINVDNTEGHSVDEFFPSDEMIADSEGGGGGGGGMKRRLLQKRTQNMDDSEGHSLDEQEAINVDNEEGHSVDEFFPSDKMIAKSEESENGGMRRRLLQRRTKVVDDSEGHSVDEQEAINVDNTEGHLVDEFFPSDKMIAEGEESANAGMRRRLLEKKRTNNMDDSEGHSVDEQEAINVDNSEGHSVDEFFPSDKMIADSEESAGGGMRRRLLQKKTDIVDNSEGHSVDEQEAINVDNSEGHSVDEFFPSDTMIAENEESGGGGRRRLLQKKTDIVDNSEGHSVDEQEAINVDNSEGHSVDEFFPSDTMIAKSEESGSGGDRRRRLLENAGHDEVESVYADLLPELLGRPHRRLLEQGGGHDEVESVYADLLPELLGRPHRRRLLGQGGEHDEVESVYADLLPELFGRGHRRLLGQGGGHDEVESVYADLLPELLGRAHRRLLGQDDNKRPTPDITVAKDGSGKYKTITEALKAIPEKRDKRFVIHVKEGTYDEQVVIPYGTKNLTMYGDGSQKTIISGNKGVKGGFLLKKTPTIRIFGEGFMAQSMGFRNTAGSSNGPAVAAQVQTDRAIFVNCRFEGYQNTLWVATHRQFFKKCVIIGTLDFIFGDAAAFFQNCEIQVRKPETEEYNVIMASGRIESHEATGIVLQKCKIIPHESMKDYKDGKKTYLSRPWKEYGITVVMESQIEAAIAPEGYVVSNGNKAMTKSVFFAEYKNSGGGANTDKRVDWPGVHIVENKKNVVYFTAKYFIQPDWVTKLSIEVQPGFYSK